MITRANRYAGVLASPDAESMRPILSSWPESKSTCYRFCGTILSNWHPAPMEEGWVTFGFCACPDEFSESELGVIYRTLLERCTFNEFWHAYDEYSLIALFDRHGLKDARLRIPNLEVVLNGSPRASVWYLKQFVVDETESVAPRLSVCADYGFDKCNSPSLVEDLKRIYKQLLLEAHVDPVKLHEVCIAGNLFRFASGFMKFKKAEKKRSARLMKNPYPLTNFELEVMRGWDGNLRVVIVSRRSLFSFYILTNSSIGVFRQ
ncbi:hypothetical protein IEO21_09872 [Rhodonia placenta]|uniref:Uncharacterized protein n=1 Tax=Rhodonia placenta TaxID=104341 RepID=A0A8H7NTM9_9APHY|nr:hypothetical protein IEO21_09872 [Postia placenta]